MSVQSICNISVTVERATQAQDAAGSQTLTWASHLTSQRFKIDENTGIEAIRYQRETGRLLCKGYTPGAPDIKARDRVVYGTRNFDVQSVRIRRWPGGAASHLEMELEETK